MQVQEKSTTKEKDPNILGSKFYKFIPNANKRANRAMRRMVLQSNGNNCRKMTLARLKMRQVIPTSFFEYEGQWLPIGKLPHKILLDPEKQNALPRMIVNKTVVHFGQKFNK